MLKELLKSDSICQSYATVTKGPVFLSLTVYILAQLTTTSSENMSAFQLLNIIIFSSIYQDVL